MFDEKKANRAAAVFVNKGKNSVVKKMREEGILDEDCRGVDNAIAELKKKLAGSKFPEEEIDNLIKEAFEIGVDSGFARCLSRFQDGKITARKVANENFWVLHCDSYSYQITRKLPSAAGNKIDTTVTFTLASHGFE